MGFQILKGTFHIVGYSPDGDSIRFQADDPKKWLKLEGRGVKMNRKGHAQLRIEAIDTLETHFMTHHQPAPLADLATENLFSLLGITEVEWNSSRSQVLSANDAVPGYILSRGTDKYGRPIAFLFKDIEELRGKETIFLNEELSQKSANYAMLYDGFAYPTFYDGFFYDLRAEFAAATKLARATRRGIWEVDKTRDFITIDSLGDITDKHVLLPKLFRRLADFIVKNGGFNGDQFLEHLQSKREKVLVLNILHFTHLDNLIHVNRAGEIRFTQDPENLVFIP